MPRCKIHNVGFYKPEAKAIYSMSLNRQQNKLAISRCDASIEIWNLDHLPFIEKSIVPTLDNFSVEGLCWIHDRLFSVGLHGFLVEYNLYGVTVKNKWSITGEAGTCLDSHNNRIAVGTEQGYVNIFQTIHNGVEFEKFLDKQEGRVVCLKFNSSGEFIVAGSVNAIRIWNVKTGHAIHKMILGRSETKKDTIVWCLEVMTDFTIFSGDSRGVLTLWDGKIGAQIESYQSHHADITAICVDTNECSIYAAGVDPLISNYEKVKVGSNFRWVKSIQRKIHEHDVRTMVIHKGRLYSAGLDSYLVCSYYPPKTLIKYAPILQTPCIQVTSSTSRRILLRYSNYLEVWSLSRTQNVPSNFKGIVEPEERPKKLLTLQKLGKNWAEEDEAESIVCASISSNGKWIFLGSCTGFRLYSFELAKTKPKLTKIEDLDDSNVPCVQAAFNDKRNQLIIALNSGKLIVYDLENNDPFIFQRIEVENGQLSDTVSLLTVSTCGKYLVIADAKSNITVFKYTKDGYSFLVKLPKYQASPTALSVNSTTGCLVVAYADYKVWEYSLQNKHLTGLSKKLESTPGWKVRTHTIRSITFDSKQSIFLHDDSSIIVIVREVSGAKEVEKKLKKEQSMHNGFGEDVLQIRSISKYKHLVHLGNVAEDEFVAVEVNPLSILKNLPPAFAQKTFGSK